MDRPVPSFYKMVPPADRKPAASPDRRVFEEATKDEARHAALSWLLIAAAVLGGCAVFAGMVKLTGREQLLAAETAQAAEPVRPAAQPPRAGGGFKPQEREVGPILPPGTQPLRWQDLTLMLRTGLSDDEIVAAAAGKQLVARIGPAEEDALREMGAGTRLLAHLRASRLYADPGPAAPVRGSAAAPRAVAPNAYNPPGSAAPAAPAIDYAARDRQVADLKRRMEELDETIRRVRADPAAYGIYGGYSTRFQQSSESYLAQLDKQRNDLRRQKWALERFCIE